MVIDIKMCRFDNVPWGFRLVGGSDFEIPLTVVKVTEGSIAEQSGLRVGDVIVRINDDATSPMSHDEAHKVISHCGNVFYLGIYREDEESEKERLFPITRNLDIELSRTPDSLIDSSIQSHVDELPNDFPYEDELRIIQAEQRIIEAEQGLLQAEQRATRSTSRISQDKENVLVEDPVPNKINENENVLVEEPAQIKIEEEKQENSEREEVEVVNQHNNLGVNCYRIYPKPAVCNSSEVLRQLNEEAIKTKLEREKEKKKWTTFMQKPDRPIPKSRQQLEAEARAANAYKVQIVKNYKKPEPVRPPSPIPEPKAEPEPEEPPKAETPPPPEVEEEPPTDSEVPNLEPTGDDTTNEDGGKEAVQNGDEEKAGEDENQELTKETSIEKDPPVDDDEKAPSESGSLREKTEEELQLEQQLAEVQRQLLALANLPSTIQSTLDAVTRQLSELLPTFKLQPNIVREATPLVAKDDEKKEEAEDKTEEEPIEPKEELIKEEIKSEETTETEIVETTVQQEVTIETEIKQEVEQKTVQVVEEKFQMTETSERNIEEEQMEEEQNLKRKKEHGVIEELQKQIEQKETQKRKRSKRLFGPLVPQERPLVLPGGRRWYRPKDAYNDEFIAETLTAQAELIAGTAVGFKHDRASPGHEERYSSGTDFSMKGGKGFLGKTTVDLWQIRQKKVNFLKYQKPEKKIDLDKSEVYKVIHHLDRSPIRGIEVRPPVVLSAADVRRIVES